MIQSEDLAVLNVATTAVDKFEPRGTIAGAGSAYYAVIDNGSNNLVTLRYRLKDVTVRANEQAFKSGDQDNPPGSFILGGSAYDPGESKPSTSKGLTCRSVIRPQPYRRMTSMCPEWPCIRREAAREVNWVRYAFDKYELKYDLIFKERVKQGNLRAAYDVIVMPNQGRSAKGLVYDIDARAGKPPLAYKKTDQFKNLGLYGESDDITGGIWWKA